MDRGDQNCQNRRRDLYFDTDVEIPRKHREFSLDESCEYLERKIDAMGLQNMDTSNEYFMNTYGINILQGP